MQTETINKIYQNYLRFLGLSCYSPNRTVEYLLIAYHLLIICHDINHAYEKYTVIETDEAEFLIMSNFIVLIETFLFLFYKITRILFCLRAIVWRKVEMRIFQKLQEIEDDFQLKLFHEYDSSKYTHCRVYKYFWLVDLSWWHAFVIICVWHYNSLWRWLWNYRITFTVQATRAVYWQFVLFIKKIDETLENLENCLNINLQRQLQQQQQLNKHPPEINNECIAMSILSLLADDSGISFNNWPNRELKPYLLQRIWIMKCIYGKILQVTNTCSLYFGSSVLLVNFLCIWDFTEFIYIMVTVMGFGSFSMSTLIYGLYNVLPSLIILIVLCHCSEKCSKRAINISKQLKMSSRHDILIDDFILQIVQNPIQFSAFSFYVLNLATLFQIFVLVVEFLVIFLQLFFLTQVV